MFELEDAEGLYFAWNISDDIPDVNRSSDTGVPSCSEIG